MHWPVRNDPQMIKKSKLNLTESSDPVYFRAVINMFSTRADSVLETHSSFVCPSSTDTWNRSAVKYSYTKCFLSESRVAAEQLENVRTETEVCFLIGVW